MSAKDVIVGVLKANRDSHTINDDMRVTDPIILEEDFEKVAQQILDSLPKLSRDKVRDIVDARIIYREESVEDMIDKICSLVPAGEVVAEGKVKDDAFEYAGGYKIGGNDIDSFFYEHHNQSGTLVWVPDKEVEE